MTDRPLTRALTLAQLREAGDAYVGSVQYESPVGEDVPPDPDGELQEARFSGRVAAWQAEGMPLAESQFLARYEPDLHPRNRLGHWIETPDAPIVEHERGSGEAAPSDACERVGGDAQQAVG